MLSIKDVYKIGKGPSSSHTMGPNRAAKIFAKRFPSADKVEVILYGSLAKTGRGHHTDYAVTDGLKPIDVEIKFDKTTPASELPHENTMKFIAYKDGEQIGEMTALSIGGGDIQIAGENINRDERQVYTESSFAEIAEYCMHHEMRLSDFVYQKEGESIKEYLGKVWDTMLDSIHRGLSTQGILEGGLGVERKAYTLFSSRHIDESASTKENRLVCAYAFAVGEENAQFGTVVTAPTCGSCSVVPAVMKYESELRHVKRDKIIDGLAVGGLIGNIIKTNASISGAECGCQAEMGSACSMASAALCEMLDMGILQIEYAAEVALEHQLGLTCDPVCGLVQIPCIERGAVSAMRAINCMSLANFLSSSRKISFDMLVDTMYRTGKDISSRYRETSEGGLAESYDTGKYMLIK